MYAACVYMAEPVVGLVRLDMNSLEHMSVLRLGRPLAAAAGYSQAAAYTLR